jgi:hypothetical protein
LGVAQNFASFLKSRVCELSSKFRYSCLQSDPFGLHVVVDGVHDDLLSPSGLSNKNVEVNAGTTLRQKKRERTAVQDQIVFLAR